MVSPDNCWQCINLEEKSTWYFDYDQDGYGDGRWPYKSCKQPGWYTDKAGDCNDYNANKWTGKECGEEDGCLFVLDEDCKCVEKGDARTTYYLDADGDSFGNPAVSISTCGQPESGYVTNDGD